MPRKKSEPIGGVEIKGVANVFRYNAKYEGMIDGNSVQIPFLAEYRGKRFNKLVYTWHTKGKYGEQIKRGIEVNGDGEFGVPTTYDYDVLCALQRIFIKNKTQNGMCQLIKEGYDEDYLNIDFTIYDLAEEMGLNRRICNYTRDKIKKSLKILMNTTITSIEQGGLYDITSKKYIMNKEHSFHLLESIITTEIVEQGREDEILKDITKIRLSKFIYEQMCNNYKLIYNNNTIYKTKNVAARKMYHQLLQIAGKEKVAHINIKSLIERNPIKSKNEIRQKEYVKKILKIIEESKMAYVDINKDIITVKFKNKQDKGNNKTTENLILDKYKKFKDIKARFYEIGFDILETEEILDENIEDIKYIQALLRYYDIKESYEKVDNPKSFILNYIENKYEINEKFFS